MDLQVTASLPLERIEAILAMPLGEFWVALAVLGLTASIYASGIPGALLPISFSSGALLGGALAMAAVSAGALVGALVLYALLERGSKVALRRKYGGRLERVDDLVARGGILPIIGLRLAGVPHVAVTALCAMATVGVRRYAIATLIGIFPAIALAAAAGAAL
jgi:uncharacterized membrane protein YdjX (TVP38/TMEM64 family)